MVTAGCGDLAVNGFPECLADVSVPEVSAQIRNEGSFAIVLDGDWTKPWVTMYPDTQGPDQFSCPDYPHWCSATSPHPVPGQKPALWLQPVVTGSTTTLKPGDSITVKLGFPPKMPVAFTEYHLTIEVDPGHNYAETSEYNNKAFLTIHPCG
jgi:hypothetical protein